VLHSQWAGSDSLKDSLRHLSIELVDCIGSTPCSVGRHEFWTFKRIVGA